jgi:hypothetical protein
MRCKHGFEREVVPCPECDPRAARDFTVRTEAQSRERNARAYARKRGQGETVDRPGTYVCRGCGQEKPLSEFYVSRNTKLGHQSRCKVCDNSARRSFRRTG